MEPVTPPSSHPTSTHTTTPHQVCGINLACQLYRGYVNVCVCVLGMHVCMHAFVCVHTSVCVYGSDQSQLTLITLVATKL